jgi:hypothetical protein
MGLFDLFSGKDDAEEAAAKNAALYRQYGIDTTNLYGDYKTGATDVLGGAKTAAVGALGTGLTNTLGALNTGLEGSLGAGRAGVAAYAPLSQLGQSYAAPVNAYYDALGLTGPEGVQRTQQRFTTGPGYQFQVDEATKNAINAASRTGAVGGGSTAQAIADRARGLASGEYSSYLDRLAGFVTPQLQATTAAAGGIAGANKTLADIYSQGYGAIGGAYGANASQTAGLESGYGSDVSNVLGNYTAGRTQSLKGADAQGHHGGQRGGQPSRRPGRSDRRLEPVGLAGCGRQSCGRRLRRRR